MKTKTLERYQLKNNSFIISEAGRVSVFTVHDQPSDFEQTFRDAFILFKLRVAKLGNLKLATTADDQEAMAIMLETLVQAKQLRQGK